MSQTIHETFQQLRKAVLQGPGALSQEERQRIAAWSAHPDQGPASQQMDEPLAKVLAKVTRHAYKVTDEDIQGLLAAGYSEDAVFEAVISTALGTAIGRYERGMAVLRETKGAGDVSGSPGGGGAAALRGGQGGAGDGRRGPGLAEADVEDG